MVVAVSTGSSPGRLRRARCWDAIACVILFVQRKDRPAESMIRLDVAIAAGEGRTRRIRGAI